MILRQKTWLWSMFAGTFILLLAGGLPAHADGTATLQECACIADDEERLQCYDRIVRATESQSVAEDVGVNATSSVLATEPVFIAASTTEKPSYLTSRWELDESIPRGRFVLMTHRENYLLPLSYNVTPNRQPGHTEEPTDVKEMEVKFQLSMKIKLWQDVLGQNMDLWFGYTQKSFWQLYDVENSCPFRETNYEPEILLNYRTDIPVLGMRLRTITAGFNHQSNGRTEPLSRSWNRLVANLGLEYEDFVLQFKGWYRIPESEDEDDNPDMDEYMGPGEIWGWYLWGEQRFGAMWRNNCRFKHNRGALQLEWAFPLGGSVSGYIQYFTGYGESLLDYDHAVDRISIGFILKDWD